ncbi:cytochrome P450 [Streptomyces sp. TRM 70351]|uniref:cytochrome P450 n=1 Tax=Streptomyces sp. TRM 70351 TaxID=3116552 RepID=UPI002E7ADB7A|nr:cytochrome P450 [Streptomyces sp. TRM 70351]MEE1927092.1 cytochrome P450 [Streptomyces sp. TRM 70351]
MDVPLRAAATTRRAGPARADLPDLAGPGFWRLPPSRRLEAFARLRTLAEPAYFVERPATWHGRERGFHALVRHADVVTASRTPRVFTSAPGATTPPPARWVRALFGDSMVNLDGPGHARLRRVVSRAFTPRVLAEAERDVAAVAARVVDDMIAAGPGDFVSAVASRVPFEVICDLMGIPAHCRPAILDEVGRASENTGVHRGLRLPGRGLRALARMQRMVARLGRQRRREPAGDLLSALVTARPGGETLSGRELGAFFSLLMVAGVETTRNALAHGLVLLTAHPEQRALLAGDFERYADGAVEEIVRHATPIIQFRRTVAEEYALGGRTFRPGDTVVLCYAAANRDPEVFPDPDAFDITRSPNPHLGYGGGGPHYCLGAHLARLEMRALFGELLARTPGIRATGEPVLAPSSFDHRVRSLPFTLTPP